MIVRIGTLAAGLLFAIAPARVHAQQDSTIGAEPPPPGYGTLHQDDVGLSLETTTLQIRVIPLDERVTRLLAPDTYTSFHRLRESRTTELSALANRYGIASPTLFLVTFFGRQDQARFDPQELTIMSQNQFFRPLEIIPLSPLWSGQLLGQRETATAIYVFEDGVRVMHPFTVSYQDSTSDAWGQILRQLEGERAAALSRAAAERKP